MIWVDAEVAEAVKNKVDFALSGAVEVAPEGGDEAEDAGVGVALDGVVGLDVGEELGPLVELLDNRG